MAFDFTDYTYSALITIFSMIMGMAYPLINSSIIEVDAKYGSNRMALRFLSDPSYVRFKASLALSVVSAILAPFILLLFKDNLSSIIVWSLLHTIVVLNLIIRTIILYRVLMIFKIPDMLLRFLENSLKADDNVYLVSEIARYAAINNYPDLYINSRDLICRELYRQHIEHKVQLDPTALFPDHRDGSRLNKSAKDALSTFTSIICNKNIEWALYKSDIAPIATFFGYKNRVTSGDRSIIWRAVSEAALFGNDVWIENYWEQATQYFTFYDNQHNYYGQEAEDRKQMDEEKKEFHRMHTAMLGMLLHYGRKELVGKLLYKSRTLPYTYPLCNNTFIKIFNEWCTYYHGLDIRSQMEQLNTFPIAGLFGNIDDEKKLLNIIERALGLQLIRLKGLEASTNYHGVLNLLTKKTKVEDNEYNLIILQRMRMVLHDIFDSGINNILKGHDAFSKDEVIDFIKKNEDVAKGAIVKIEDTKVIDEEKRKSLISSLLHIWESYKWKFRDSSPMVAYSVNSNYMTISSEIPNEYLVSGYDSCDVTDFIHNIVNSFYTYAEPVILNAFDLVKPIRTFNVQYHQIIDTLKRLFMNKDYTIIFCNINVARHFSIYHDPSFQSVNGEYFYNGAEIIEISKAATESFIVICKKEEVPCCKISKYEDSPLAEVSSNPYLYSNLMNLKVEELNNCLFGIKVDLLYVPTFKYIKICMHNLNVLPGDDGVTNIHGLIG